MTATLARIVRHPVKAIGREELDSVTLSPGRPLPWDRAWAVAHEKSKIEGPGWSPKINFLRGVTGPGLMAVETSFDPDGPVVTFRHPDRPELTITPGDAADEAALINWLAPIWPSEAPRPTRLVGGPDHAMTDVPEPWIAINSLSSHAAVAEALDALDLSIHRWRGNLWVEGLAPWAEFDWIGKRVRIGDSVLHVRSRITRCKATMANPVTGERDADTLGALRAGWGHQDFGVYAVVMQGGQIAPGAKVEPQA